MLDHASVAFTRTENSWRLVLKPFRLGFFDIILFAEPFYTAGSIHQLLLAGKEWVTGGANFHLNILYC